MINLPLNPVFDINNYANIIHIIFSAFQHHTWCYVYTINV
jgi:hypothetical protein